MRRVELMRNAYDVISVAMGRAVFRHGETSSILRITRQLGTYAEIQFLGGLFALCVSSVAASA